MNNNEVLNSINEAIRLGEKTLVLEGDFDILPPEIGLLISLTSLTIKKYKNAYLPVEIAMLSNLENLHINDSEIISLPGEIANLSNLNLLDISRNKLSRLPEEIGQLVKLKFLYLRENKLIALPKEIGKLTNLTSLVLYQNELTTLPSEIGQLTNLTTLDLCVNQLLSLPKEIRNLNKLESLLLFVDKLDTIPSEIGELTSLKELDLRRNNLTFLPPEIGNLHNLETLDLRDNQLSNLPKEIEKLTNLNSLKLQGNQFDSISPEIFEQNPSQIINFFRELNKGDFDYVYEAKLLIVGEGGAGKTTLAKKLIDPNYNLQIGEAATDGIDILKHQFPFRKGKNFQINIWDFGGQQIYHQTHKFFLTKRSLYVLVADARKENTDFFYWLNIVGLLSENSPILIVKNERDNIKLTIDEGSIRGSFPDLNLRDFLPSNFANNNGLSHILDTIKHYITKLPHVGEKFPRNWIRVREFLERDSRNYMPFDEFSQICKDNGFTSSDAILSLSKYLNDIGVHLHFPDHVHLNRIVILKPTWATDAVYKVLRNPKVIENQGKFSSNDLNEIWRDDKYADKLPELLELMMKFKLCYKINESDEYIAPQLLSSKQVPYKWEDSENLHFCYRYDFLPNWIISELIVRMHDNIENQCNVWRTGMILNKDNTRAEIIEHSQKGEIRIRVSGLDKKGVLSIINDQFEKIHANYKWLKFSEIVPCSCDGCITNGSPHSYDLGTLKYFLLAKSKPRIQCYKNFKMIDVSSLIRYVYPESITSEIHASVDRDLQNYESLQEEWYIFHRKLRLLRNQCASEANAAEKFSLTEQIKKLETEISAKEKKLKTIEHDHPEYLRQ